MKTKASRSDRGGRRVLCLWGCALTALLSFSPGEAAAAERAPAQLSETRFSVSFRNTPLKEALALIAAKADLDLRIDGDLKGSVNFARGEATLLEALDHLVSVHKVEYRTKGGAIYVVQSEETGDAEKGGAPAGDQSFRSVPIRFANAREILPHVGAIIKKGESIVADDINNALIVYGSDRTFSRIKEFVEIYDQRPSQILIEAQIVETTRSFARELGLSWGDLQAPANVTPKFSGSVTMPGPSTPNITLRGLLGSIDGRQLEARLTAGETAGEAKVVSRPKVFALNNRKATIHSGITYHIKTLSAVSTGSGGGDDGGDGGAATTATGGVREISAGLQLEVTPTIVGDEVVRLLIRVQNSEPNEGSSVDGIPGIINNSAETSILVKSGLTATMAGLIKNSASKGESRVPWLSKLPVLGWLFKSISDRDRASELMIFITPHIVSDFEGKTASN